MEELDLKELFTIFWTRKAQIILIVLVFILIGVFYTLFMVTPEYKASTTLVLTKVENGTAEGSGITQTDVQLNQRLITTYSELVKSRAVLGKVIQNLNLDVSEEYLRKNVSVASVKNTELMRITVTHENNYYVDDIIIAEYNETRGNAFKFNEIAEFLAEYILSLNDDIRLEMNVLPEDFDDNKLAMILALNEKAENIIKNLKSPVYLNMFMNI